MRCKGILATDYTEKAHSRIRGRFYSNPEFEFPEAHFDLVMAPTAEQLRTLKTILPESEYYFDLDDAMDALKRSRQFNIIDLASGWKIDFIIRSAVVALRDRVNV